jgi:hypothetical protein
MQRSTLAPLLVAISIAVAAPAFAAKGGNGNGNGGGSADNGGGGSSQPVSGTTSNIEIASVTSRSGATATVSAVRYGDRLTFSTTVEKLAGYEWPMVAVTCYQDVNGDGTVNQNIDGPDLVFAQLNHPDSTFDLDGSSLWSQRGGNAVCRADLDAYGGRGDARVLDSTENWNVTW